MSRAIGDLFLKPYVSAKPDVLAMPLEPADEFLVIAKARDVGEYRWHAAGHCFNGRQEEVFFCAVVGSQEDV